MTRGGEGCRGVARADGMSRQRWRLAAAAAAVATASSGGGRGGRSPRHPSRTNHGPVILGLQLGDLRELRHGRLCSTNYHARAGGVRVYTASCRAARRASPVGRRSRKIDSHQVPIMQAPSLPAKTDSGVGPPIDWLDRTERACMASCMASCMARRGLLERIRARASVV